MAHPVLRWIASSGASVALFWAAWRIAWATDTGWTFIPAATLSLLLTGLHALRTVKPKLLAVLVSLAVVGVALVAGTVLWWAFVAFECRTYQHFCIDSV
jgi:uncharacterized membrane protein YesL